MKPASDEQHPREAPRLLWPACGALCDIFWWGARRDAESVDPPAVPADSAGKES
ncbi:MAG: hypothetical protein JO121_13410 [Deltaproteobacteria bacterium]|nr:hypothetical protein [Deltaproteobacteria bacterium]